MPFTPVSASDPVAPLENILNTRFTELDNSITAATTGYAVKTYKWANQAARAAQTGMSEGDIGDQADTNTIYRYSGTAWLPVDGLVPIKPTSVSATGGTASVSNGGAVMFTNATGQVNVLGAFSSVFENYLIEFVISSKSAASNIGLSLQAGGSNITTNVTGVLIHASGTTSTVLTNGAAAFTGLYVDAVGNAGRSRGRIEVYSPALATPTGMTCQATLGSGAFVANSSFDHSLATAYTDCAITISTGSITGSFRFYGYNNNI